MIRAFFIGLLIACGAVLSAQTLSAPDSEKLIDYLKKDDVVSALEFVRAKKLSASVTQFQKAEELLADAGRRSAAAPQRAELKGDVARLLGSYVQALAFYQDAIDRIESHFQKYGGYRSSHTIAYKAATCAFWIQDYERAFSLLSYIEKTGDTWVKDFGRDRGNMLKEFILAPNDPPLRIKFAKGFWLSNVPAVGQQSADAIRFLEETQRLDATRRETKQIYILIRNTAQENGDIETAENYLKKMIAEFARQEFVIEAAFSTSQYYYSKKQFADSRRWLGWVIANDQPNGNFLTLGYLGLAEVYEKLGDMPAMLKYLKIAAQNPNTVAANRGIMDRSNTRQVALVRLGNYYKAQKNYEEALKYFTEWKPGGGGCGNCMAQAKYQKDLSMGECLVGLGMEGEALEKYLVPNLKIDGGALYADAKIPRLVVSIYEKRNALNEFLAMIGPHAASKYNHAAQIAATLAQIKLWGKNGEIGKLAAEIKHAGGYVPNITSESTREGNWQAVAIAKELAKMDGKEFPVLRKRYTELLLSKRDDAFGDRLWIIYALGASNAKESEAFLQELLQKAKNENASSELDDIVFALSMKTAK